MDCLVSEYVIQLSTQDLVRLSRSTISLQRHDLKTLVVCTCSGQVLYDEQGRVAGIATADAGLAKDGTPGPGFTRG